MLKLDYTNSHPQDAIIAACNADNDLLLDLVDARLELGISSWTMLEDLIEILALAGSGWRINERRNGLEQVVDATVRAVVLDATATPGSAANTWHQPGRRLTAEHPSRLRRTPRWSEP